MARDHHSITAEAEMFPILAPLLRLPNCQIKYTSHFGLLMASEVTSDLAPKKARKETSNSSPTPVSHSMSAHHPVEPGVLIKRCTLKIWLHILLLIH